MKVVTGCEATPEIVKEGNPVAVFLASGGKPIIPDLPGINKEKVVLASEVITGAKEIKGNIVIVGAGLTGLETAEVLFNKGAATKVTVIDMVETIGANMYPAVFMDVTYQMEGKPLELKPSLLLKEVADTGIVATNLKEEKDETFDADYVVLAMGTRKDTDTIEKFEKAFPRVIPLGQTHKNPGRIATSMAEAYIAARGFDPVA